jgi:hypothetical protein
MKPSSRLIRLNVGPKVEFVGTADHDLRVSAGTLRRRLAMHTVVAQRLRLGFRSGAPLVAERL